MIMDNDNGHEVILYSTVYTNSTNIILDGTITTRDEIKNRVFGGGKFFFEKIVKNQ